MTGEFKFTQADYESFFKDLDKDGSGDVDKEEMFRFVRQVCGCPTKEDLEASKKVVKPKRGELTK
jgi:Ca2+-binding EF-hand superfamily protein